VSVGSVEPQFYAPAPRFSRTRPELRHAPGLGATSVDAVVTQWAAK
jgi:hypothetical protein